MEKESVKISKEVLSKLRKIADRDGMVLGRLIERLIRAGIVAENLK
jgi:predicted DNA-binding ribbon-helix-helix protein